MLLRADIILDRRPIISWLFEPLLGAREVIDVEDLKQLVSTWAASIATMHKQLVDWLVEIGLLRPVAVES